MANDEKLNEQRRWGNAGRNPRAYLADEISWNDPVGCGDLTPVGSFVTAAAASAPGGAEILYASY
ncbi:MAG TPA: hypothetical protein VFC78_11365 [Tepidisphaeraceae bacterium]|nr:hypothetical protein [Tepidisphaeraceae bacterium]